MYVHKFERKKISGESWWHKNIKEILEACYEIVITSGLGMSEEKWCSDNGKSMCAFDRINLQMVFY